jgi:Fic-DOC domain mobile mystery protein B
MFNKTWRWAGTFRSSNKNIGVDWTQVSVKLRELLDNTRYQIDREVFDADEIAVRFHHQLVWVHAFSNGNGRHARLMSDLLVMRLGRPRLSWGSDFLATHSVDQLREQYIAGLRAADQGHIGELSFAAASPLSTVT